MDRRIEIVQDIDRVELFGNLDVNLDLIKEATGVSVFQRDDELILKADETVPAEEQEANLILAEKIIDEFVSIIASGEGLGKQKASYVIGLNKEGLSYKESKLAKDVICFTHKGKPLKPKTLGQKEYVKSIRENDIVFGIGPAGTGKTYIAVAMAINAFKNKEVSKIILARPAVEAGERLGFLPGDLQSKIDPYLRPLYDALYELMGAESFARNMERGVIEIAPLAYMRGRTLDDSFIILDEAQNTTPEQMKMFLTRLGFGSKIIITGDVTQIDLPDNKKSGLLEAMKVLKNIDDIGIVRFSEKDVVRHKLVQDIVKAYDKYYEEGKKRHHE